MKFVRFGNLTPRHHDISDGEWFHTPPVEVGIYAFPKGFVERFLLGGVGSGSVQNGRYRYLKDRYGKRVMMTYEEYSNSNYFTNSRFKLGSAEEDEWEDGVKYPLLIQNHPNHFEYNGLIWYHLKQAKYRNEFIKETKFWCLTDIKTYEKCLRRALNQDKLNKTYYDFTECGGTSARKDKEENGTPIPDWRGMIGPGSKDHYEVFIENIQHENKIRR